MIIHMLAARGEIDPKWCTLFNRGQLRKATENAVLSRFKMQFAYGHREILLKAADLTLDSVLLGIVQHGVGPSFVQYSDWPTPKGFNLSRSPLWVYSKTNEFELRNLGVKDVRAIGSPWLYSKKMEESKGHYIQKKYCLVFASHTRFNFSLTTELDEILDKIKFWKTIAGNDELAICLYWVDFLDENWKLAAKIEGVELLCAGIDFTDPVWSLSPVRLDFYSNLNRIIQSAHYCIFEGFTSAIFYAASQDVPFGVFRSKFEDKKILSSQFFSKEHQWLRRYARRNFENICENHNFTDVSNELLGIEDLLTSEELRNELLWMKMSFKYE